MNVNRDSGKAPQIVVVNMDTSMDKKGLGMNAEYSPLKRSIINKERLQKPIGDLREYIFNMMMYTDQDSFDAADQKAERETNDLMEFNDDPN